MNGRVARRLRKEASKRFKESELGVISVIKTFLFRGKKVKARRETLIWGGAVRGYRGYKSAWSNRENKNISIEAWIKQNLG
jgi:hypothetical protein